MIRENLTLKYPFNLGIHIIIIYLKSKNKINNSKRKVTLNPINPKTTFELNFLSKSQVESCKLKAFVESFEDRNLLKVYPRLESIYSDVLSPQKINKCTVRIKIITAQITLTLNDF